MNAPLNEPIGHYRSHEQTRFGVVVTAENAVLEIRVYAGATVRVIARHLQEPLDDFSYAVIAEPEETEWRLETGPEKLLLHTRGLIVRVDKHPVRVSFYTPEGGLINADEPAFGISWIGETVTAYKSLQDCERFIGLGEKTGNLDRRGSAYVNWNTDHFGYPAFADPLYASIPFYIGIHSGLIYGIYLDNTHLTRFNFGAANNRFASFSADSGPMDYYFFHGASVGEVISAYTALTGRMPLPPIWSLGYQQCRYSYFPDTEVLRVARTFREKQFPADVIYLDIHYMDDFKVFTWDQERFSDPAGLVEKLKELGFHTAAIVDPGIKIEQGYEPYENGLEKDVFVKYPDGEPYAGEVWPGWCHFPDFTNPETRTWWGKWLKTLTEAGVEGVWCDMNEPAAWGKQVPDLIEFNHEGRPCTHKKARNIYGMQMARAAREAADAQLSGRRPFVLTRAGFAGVQRYAAMWTGDNIADDDHMLAAIRLINSMGISGIGFAGCDIPGFAGEASSALFCRWIALGAFSPLFRGHTAYNTRSAEPWAFGEEAEEIARYYIRLRYRLMPYIYSLFAECAATGMPPARTLAIDRPHDPHVYGIYFHNQYLFGPNLLVVPVRSDQFITKAYLPKGRWFDFYTDREVEGGREVYVDAPLSRLPVFVPAGAVIPMQEPVSSTMEAPKGPLQLHVWPPAEHPTGFVYYEDDGVSFDYRKGRYFQRTICLEKDRLMLMPAEGESASRFEQVEIRFHGPGMPTDPQALPHCGQRMEIPIDESGKTGD